jgi:fatty-acyl-CoA synthase
MVLDQGDELAPRSASYACGTSTIPLTAETIGANLQRTAGRYPDNDALVSRHQGIHWSYREFDGRVNALAQALIDAGLENGDRIGVWSPNRAEWPLVQYATAKAGLILVNINPAYRTSELRYALAHSGCRWLFAAAQFKDSSFTEMVASVRAELPELERAIFFGSDEWRELAEGSAPGPPSAALSARMESLDCDQPINIQYTSGTTGFPKGATLTHHNILNNALLLGQILSYGSSDRICCPVPLYHCFGMVMCNLAATNYGCCIVYPSEAFEPQSVLETVQSERCTALYGVPTMFIAELGHAEFARYDLGSLRTGIMAGSPCPVEVMKQVVSSMGITEMSIAFGMTETSPVTMMVRTGDTLEHSTATVGQVMSHTEVKIIDPASGRTVPRGATGEFLARGYPVMRGYWNDAEKTAEAIDTGRWMHTGDLATMDDDGYVRIVGRAKDMIIRGGENVYPREVEEFLYTHEAIQDVQVIGVPDTRYGEQLMAWIVLKPDVPLSEEQVRDYCNGQIARFKVPHYIKFVDSFPMTVTGKIQKYKMRESAVEELGLQDAAAVVTA